MDKIEKALIEIQGLLTEANLRLQAVNVNLLHLNNVIEYKLLPSVDMGKNYG